MPAPLYGQVQVTTSPQRLTSPVAVAAWTLKAPSTNLNTVFIGDTNVTLATGFPLPPGDTIEYERAAVNGRNPYPLNPSDIWVAGTAGDYVGWFGSPVTS